MLKRDPDLENWMRMAVAEARQCTGELKVGAILVKEGLVLGTGHKEAKRHAEQALLEDLREQGESPRGGILFTTLEPCVAIGGRNRIACSDLLIAAQVSTVFIGGYDPNSDIYRLGWKQLNEAGIVVRDFYADIRQEIEEINKTVTGHFEYGCGPTGGARFDYSQNGGNFRIYMDNSLTENLVTTWSTCNVDAVYASVGRPGIVALARYASKFEQIDDPDALDYDDHCPRFGVGEIAVFRNEKMHVLVKVLDVKNSYGSSTTASPCSLKIEFEVRERSL